jgi:hypothetical protein
MVNSFGLPHFHTFQDGGPRMIWDFNLSSMEELNANENKHVMGFQIDTTTMQNMSKIAHR